MPSPLCPPTLHPPERAPQTISLTLRHRWAELNAGPAEAASLWAVGSGTVQAACGVRVLLGGPWLKVLQDSPGPPSVAKGRFPGVRTAEESRRSGSARVRENPTQFTGCEDRGGPSELDKARKRTLPSCPGGTQSCRP